MNGKEKKLHNIITTCNHNELCTRNDMSPHGNVTTDHFRNYVIFNIAFPEVLTVNHFLLFRSSIIIDFFKTCERFQKKIRIPINDNERQPEPKAISNSKIYFLEMHS